MENRDPPNSQPWTDSDKAELDRVLQERRHRQWLAEMLMRYAKWVAAVSLGATVVWDWVARIVKQAGS